MGFNRYIQKRMDSFVEEIRYKYNLKEDSIIFDLGGYKGEFAKTINDKFGCKVYVFEPFFEICGNDKIIVYKHGISDKTENVLIYINGNSTSVYGSGNSYEVKMVSLKQFLEANDISHVDLIKINIEGGEYRLLRHMINTGIVDYFENIQIQYHACISNHAELIAILTKDLSKTHIREWCFPYIFESWKKMCRQ